MAEIHAEFDYLLVGLKDHSDTTQKLAARFGLSMVTALAQCNNLMLQEKIERHHGRWRLLEGRVNATKDTSPFPKPKFKTEPIGFFDLLPGKRHSDKGA